MNNARWMSDFFWKMLRKRWTSSPYQYSMVTISRVRVKPQCCLIGWLKSLDVAEWVMRFRTRFLGDAWLCWYFMKNYWQNLDGRAPQFLTMTLNYQRMTVHTRYGSICSVPPESTNLKGINAVRVTVFLAFCDTELKKGLRQPKSAQISHTVQDSA